jgi:uracil-DNA glycosylase
VADADASRRRHRPAASADRRTWSWEALEARVSGCTRCPLHAGRTRTVFGVGSRNADWLIIGEAPGAEEDRRGEPFVGRAGKTARRNAGGAGIRQRDQVYIANVVKCRPPENRDPRPEEAASCAPYLDRQIELLAPKDHSRRRPRRSTAPAAGGHARRAPAGTRLTAMGPVPIPLVVTWHPAYLLAPAGGEGRCVA